MLALPFPRPVRICIREIWQRTSWGRGRAVWVGVLPLLEQVLGLSDQCLFTAVSAILCIAVARGEGVRAVAGVAWATHPLLSRLCDVSVRLEQTAEVHCLAAPEVSVDAPVKRELQRPPIKGPKGASVSAGSGRRAGGGVQDVLLGAHGDGGPSSRVRGGRDMCDVWPQCLVVDGCFTSCST